MNLKKELEEFFRYFKNALERIKYISDLCNKSDQPFPQRYYYWLDAIILTICYLDSLTSFRYGTSGKSFVKFIQTYPDEKYSRWYKKVSCWFLDNPPLGKDGRPLDKIRNLDISSIRKRLYNDEKDYENIMKNEYSIGEAYRKVSNLVDKETLNIFTYGFYFYLWYRCFLVHKTQVPIGISSSKEPYYDNIAGSKKIVFPPAFIIGTFESSIKNFQDEINKLLSKEEDLEKYKNKYEFFKEKFGIKDQFFENFLAYGI